jgi:cytoskeletal protein RodZ
MDREHFGSFLRRQREARGITLAELSRATKIKEQNLQLLEDAALDSLPARVFVVGYVGAYARAVGADEGEAMARLKQHAPDAAPAEIGDCVKKVVARVVDEGEGEGAPRALGNRRLGVALVVFLLLIVATLTLSLLLRHGGHAVGAMS